MAKARKIKKISVEKSKIERLINVFDCSRATVYNALSYKTDSNLAKKIRQKALDYYGGVLNSVRLPI